MSAARFDTNAFPGAMMQVTGKGQEALTHLDCLAKVEGWMQGENNGSLVLMGGVGTGKTCIAYAVCRCWRGEGVPRVIACDLLADRIKQEESEKYEISYHKGLLVLDDLGTEGKVYGEEVLPFVIYRRYERNLPTIITTNYDSRRLAERYGERIADRLKTWAKVVLDYKSLR